jgi:hypothetical protein
VLIGGRKFGKTSILKRLARVRLPAEGFVAVNEMLVPMRDDNEFLTQRIHNWSPQPPASAPATFADLLANPPHNVVLLLDEADELVEIDRANKWRLFGRWRKPPSRS